MAPNHSLKLAREYNESPQFSSGPETSYSSDFKWKMNTDYLKSTVARRLPNGHNPHPRDARYLTWFTNEVVCNMSTYDRPLSGYTHPHRSRRELLTTTSLTYQAPPSECYTARSVMSSEDRASLQASTGVKCALSTYTPAKSSFSLDTNYKIKTGKTINLQVDREKKQKLLQRVAREAYKPKIENRGVTKDEVMKIKSHKLEQERNLEEARYRKSLKDQLKKTKYDYSLVPFIHRNTEVCNTQTRRMINKRISSTVPGLVK